MGTEYRCPDCQNYCDGNPVTELAFCPSCGWFPKADATHTVTV